MKLFSVDDHIIEPADLWTSRISPKFGDAIPRVVDDGDTEYWVIEGSRHPTLGLNAVAGKPMEEWDKEPMRFSEMIPGCYDPRARAADLLREGIVASIGFPTLPRFGGALFPSLKDRELAAACVSAWNDYVIEEWCPAAPQMFVPMSIVQLWDIDAAVREITRNVERGVRAISIPEETSILGLPSYYSDYWDPMWSVCQETGIAVCMHIGSSGWKPYRPPESPESLGIALGFVPTITHAMGMMFSPVPRKFPRIKLVYSEGGISWVPSALERADRMYERHRFWSGVDDVTPSEVCRRNMWFCVIDEPYGVRIRHEVGIDRILWECDYPHSSCIWPDTQATVSDMMDGIPDEDIRKMAYQNAENLFNWPTTDLRNLSPGVH